MDINTVVFVCKSKKHTKTTKYMLKALKKRVKKVIRIKSHRHRYKRFSFLANYKNFIKNKIIRTNPDLILVFSFDLPLSLLKELSEFYKISLVFDDPNPPENKRLLEYGSWLDYLFVTTDGLDDIMKKKGIKKTVFCMQGCDRDEHRKIPTKNKKWASEVAFIGRRVDDSKRISLLKAIDRTYNLKVWGSDWEKHGFCCLKKNIYPKHYAKICYATKVLIGCDPNQEMLHYFSNRTWLTLGCGGFLLTNYVPGLEDIFKKGVHLEWYKTHEECLDLIGYYLKHENERKRIAITGYEFVHSNRTQDIVIDEIISTIENDNDI